MRLLAPDALMIDPAFVSPPPWRLLAGYARFTPHPNVAALQRRGLTGRSSADALRQPGLAVRRLLVILRRTAKPACLRARLSSNVRHHISHRVASLTST